MSWYSTIYTRVRTHREKHPVTGFILTLLLNTLLVLQLVGLACSYYVYIVCICGRYLPSPLQATIYVCIYFSLSFMSVWCLMTTICSGVSRVPKKFKVDEKKDAKLKAVTPVDKESSRYVVDKSTAEQTAQQKVILEEIAVEQGVTQAECDQAGRSKYCYVCCHLKPDRTHHCSSCGACVVHFDHHCPWINNCVSHANYKPFLLYVFYSTLTVIWYLISAIECIVRYFIRQQWCEDAQCLVFILLIAIPFCIFGYYPLGELLIYHFGLISINETTCEQAKPAVLKHDWHADYNLGRRENFSQIFGWGLWMFPLPTHTEDGMHFKIRYHDDNNPLRYHRVSLDASTEKSSTDDSGTPRTLRDGEKDKLAAKEKKATVRTTRL